MFPNMTSKSTVSGNILKLPLVQNPKHLSCTKARGQSIGNPHCGYKGNHLIFSNYSNHQKRFSCFQTIWKGKWTNKFDRYLPMKIFAITCKIFCIDILCRNFYPRPVLLIRPLILSAVSTRNFLSSEEVLQSLLPFFIQSSVSTPITSSFEMWTPILL